MGMDANLKVMGWRMKGKFKQIIRGWLAGGLATVVTLGLLSGCQPLFLGREVCNPSQMYASLPPPVKALEDNSAPVHNPITPPMPAPANVIYPDREPKPVTLQWCFAQALESGVASGNTQEGKVDPTLPRTPPGTTSMIGQSDRIRVLALNPAIASAQIEQSLSRFDAVWVTGMNWTNTDNLLQGLNSFNNGHNANFNSSIVKAFADGSIANVSFITQYQNLNSPPAVQTLNPQYTARVSFGAEVPLWRDAGVGINQLLSRFPSGTGQNFNPNTLALTGFNEKQSTPFVQGTGNLEGILISKLRFDQSRIEFERNVHMLVKNVEVAYWNLYNKYGQLYSFEENLRILRRAYEESYYKNKLGGGALKPYQFYQSKGQFEEFRANRIQAMQEVLDAERDLRGILGLPMEDGCRLVPITPPQLAEMRPDWEQCLHDTLHLRPELLLTRDNMRYHQYLMAISKNLLKPDLRAIGRYEPVGFGNSLTGDATFIDGTGTERSSNAFRELRQGHFADWQLGLYLNVPIGQRFEHAAIRQSRLALAQSYYLVRDAEERAIVAMTEQYQEVSRWYKQIEAHRAERLAYQEALNTFINLIKAGTENYGKLDFLSIQRSYSAALVKEYNAITEYNKSLAKLEWTKGTILRYNNIHVSEGQLPDCAQVNAAQYEKEKAREIVLKQRPDSLSHPGRFASVKEEDVPVPADLPPVPIEEPLKAPPSDRVPPAEFTPPAPKVLPPAEKNNGPTLMPQVSSQGKGKGPSPLDVSWEAESGKTKNEITPKYQSAREPVPTLLGTSDHVNKAVTPNWGQTSNTPAGQNAASPAQMTQPKGESASRIVPVSNLTPAAPAAPAAPEPLPKVVDRPTSVPPLPAAPGATTPNGSVGAVTVEQTPTGLLPAPLPSVFDSTK